MDFSVSSCTMVEDPAFTLLEDECDDIYPVFDLDAASWNRRYLSHVMRFNDVLDPGRLNAALCRLFEIGDWKKLSGRLRPTANGGLEAHVPRHFTDERPAVHFTHVEHDIPIREHPAGRQMPEHGQKASTYRMTSDLKVFQARSTLPTTLDATFHLDEPQIQLHVTSFTDATIVSFSFPHTTMDAFGIRDMIQNWCLVLAGREREVTPLLGTRSDALMEAEQAHAHERADKWSLESSHLQGFSQIRLYARLGWDTLTRPRLEKRMLYFPRDKLKSLVEESRAELSLSPAAEKGAFISEADVIAAWIVRAIAVSDTQQRPITVIGALNARYRLPELLPKEGTYVNNMVGATCAVIPPSIVQQSLACIASEHRKVVVEQAALPQMLAHLKRSRAAAVAGHASPPVTFGSSDSFHVVVNNLGKLDLLRCVDFGPAVIAKGDVSKERVNRPGTATFWYNAWHGAGPPLLASFFVYGRDWVGDGNLWCTGTLRPETWKYLERELERL